jgi:predicted ArsR family transcriptional regulator
MSVPTRDRIIKYLAEHPVVSVDDLSTRLCLTKADIRYHLGILERNSQVISSQNRSLKQHLRGRPQLCYQLVKKSPAIFAAELTKAALRLLLNPAHPGIDSEAVESIALEITKEITLYGIFPLRLRQVVQALIDRGYQARWEAHSSAPVIIIQPCPYTCILESVPELCSIDLAIIRQLLKRDITLEKRENKDNSGGFQCLFRIPLL